MAAATTRSTTTMSSLRLTIERVDRNTRERLFVDEATYLAEAKRGFYNQARVILRTAKAEPGLYEHWTANAIFQLRSEPDD